MNCKYDKGNPPCAENMQIEKCEHEIETAIELLRQWSAWNDIKNLEELQSKTQDFIQGNTNFKWGS